MESIIVFLIVAVLAGLTWTLSGYLANWRKNHKKPEWTGFDLKSMRNDAILGGVLGVAIVIIQPISVALGTPYDVPVVSDFNTFIMAIFGLYPIVAVVDKFFVGFIVGK